jgi:formylmethanofuran dehydrogenase subunit C
VSGLHLHPRTDLPAHSDLAALTAEGWEQCDAAGLAARRARVGRDVVAIGDLFRITGSPGPSLIVDGDLRHAEGVGARLSLGRVEVLGSVGDDAGLAMRGGLLRIRGSAGRNAGGAEPGARKGMTGGELLIHGDAGDEAGTAMRRGLVAIGGSAGARTAQHGIAGTVYVAGRCGADAGRFLRRVSLLVGGAVDVPAGFTEACRYDPAVVRLLQRRLRDLGFPLPAAQYGGQWRRFSGDVGEGARGELLHWTP